MNNEWFVHSNDQQMGPYTDEQMVQYAQEGNITAETLVWAEGMAEWSPASQIPGLFAEVAPAAAQPVEVVKAPAWAPPGARVPVTAATGNPQYATGSSSLTQSVPGGEYPYVPIKPASFSLWLWAFLGSFLCMILALLVFTMAAKASIAAEAAGMDQEAVASAAMGKAGFGMLLFGLGWVILLVSMIFFFINLYRAWSCLALGAPATTPGKAVGMLFIPFFNIYWIFVAIAGLPKDWNRIVASYENIKNAPKLSESVFLMYAIGSVVFPPLALIVAFPMMSQLCNGVNFFATRRNPNAPSALGGLKYR